MVRLYRIAGLRAADSRPYGAWVCPFCRGGRLDRPAVRWCFSGFARAPGKVLLRGRGKPLPYGRPEHFRIVVRLYLNAGLRADEGIGPYGEWRGLRIAGTKKAPSYEGALLEAPPGLEPGVRDLQSRALPLGYGAI